MSSETLDLSGKGKASDFEVETASDDILFILKDFKSPKDAGPAFALAHYKMLKAIFPPKFKKEAIAALKAHCDMIETFLNEGWQ